jgi:hypothetical protein
MYTYIYIYTLHIYMCIYKHILYIHTCPLTYDSASSDCHQRSNHTDCLHLHDNDDDVYLNEFHM